MSDFSNLEATCGECGKEMRFMGYTLQEGFRCYSFQCDHCTRWLGSWPLMAVGEKKIKA